MQTSSKTIKAFMKSGIINPSSKKAFTIPIKIKLISTKGQEQ